MKKLFFLLAISATCFACSRTESFPSKVLSVENVDSLGYTLVTSEVYPGRGDTIKVWIGLPNGEWDGRFVGTGGSGPVGGKATNAIKWAKKGMVGVACNTGHDVKDWTFLFDAENGCLDTVQAEDFGHYALHVMTVYAKTYVREYYGRDPHHCYFTGSSTGGRHALQVADKYPDDYDAIFSGCPAWHNDLYCPARAWAQVVMKEENHLIPMSKFDYAKDCLIAYEDSRDGLVDNIVNNPFVITFDINTIVGTKTPEGEIFTAEDARVIKRIWDGCKYEDGDLWYYFTPTTSMNKVAKSEGNPPVGKLESTSLGLMRYAVEFNPDFDLDSLTVERYIKNTLKCSETLSKYFSASTDLSALRKGGKKLVIMHGLDDDMVPPATSIRYYEELCKVSGGYEETAKFARLFLAPGVAHNFKGPGAYLRGDDLQVLIDWVEKGQAPDSLIYTKKKFGSRPFYPYPYTTVYKGGDINDPSSFGKSLEDHQSYLDEMNKVTWYK